MASIAVAGPTRVNMRSPKATAIVLDRERVSLRLAFFRRIVLRRSVTMLVAYDRELALDADDLGAGSRIPEARPVDEEGV